MFTSQCCVNVGDGVRLAAQCGMLREELRALACWTAGQHEVERALHTVLHLAHPKAGHLRIYGLRRLRSRTQIDL